MERERDGVAAAAMGGSDRILTNFERGAGEAQDTRSAKSAQEMKPWSACSIEEKLERVRQSLINVAEQQQILGPIAVGARNLVHNHGHGPQGVMKPVYEGFNEPSYSIHPMRHALALLR